MDEEYSHTSVATSMMVSFLMAIWRGKVFLDLIMAMFMRVNGLMTRAMERVFIVLGTVMFMRVSFVMGKEMVKEHSHTLMEKNM